MPVSGPGGLHPDDSTESLSESFADISGNVSSAGGLLSGIAQDVSRLVRLEIELAKQEVVELARAKAVGIGLGALGAVMGLMLVPFILLTLLEIFDLWMPRWVAALVMTLLVAAGCAGVLLLAKKHLEGTFTPERTVRSLKETVAWVKRLKR